MAYYYKSGVIVPFVQKFYKQMIVVVAGLFIASMAAMTFNASAATVAGCSFDDSVNGTWSLQGDCVSTGQINIPANTTVEGNNFTISPNWTRIDSSNNAVVGIIGVNNVTISNLNINGVNGVNLHGVNIYVANNVSINNTSIVNNDRSGIVVNGSVVDVDEVTTSGNGWSGIGVDLGGGVSGPAILNIVGPMHQSDTAQIYVDDTTKNVSVNDTLSQYTYVNPVTTPDKPNDRLYSLKDFVINKEGCKKEGWKLGVVGQSFKNQGQCVAYFASNGQNIR